MFKSVLYCLIAGIALVGCKRGKCTTDNPIFKKYTPFQREYKMELVKRLSETKGNVEYHINERVVQRWRTYMVVSVSGDGLCAKAAIDITNADNSRLAGFKKAIGGYNGAQIKGLQFSVDTTGGDYNLVYKDVEDIID